MGVLHRQPGQHSVLLSRRTLMAGVGALAAVALRRPAFAETVRILHVDSYHVGNEWNDRIAAECRRVVEAAGGEWRIAHLDAKRRPAHAQIQAAAREVVALIEAWKPHVVTTSDDPAAGYVIEPYFRDAEQAVVFCGVNWNADVYGLPYRNTTGMVEVAAIPQIVQLLAPHAKGERLGLLTEDTPTKRKEMEHHTSLFGIGYARTWFVPDFAGWVAAFREAQTSVDMLMLLGVGALTDWDDAAARRLAETETAIPTGTDFGWLVPYALMGIGKVPEEQGRWAARTALAIAGGADPADIPISYNKEGELLYNPRVARRLGVRAAPALATIVD